MSPDDLVALAIPLTWLAFMALEAAFPNHEWPRIRGWRAQGVAFFLVVMTLNAALPGLVPETWRAHALLPLDALGTAGGVSVAYLALTLCTALLHRAYHRYDLLWRWVRRFQGEVGFEGSSALPLKAALTGRDANAALYGPGNRGSSAPATNPA